MFDLFAVATAVAHVHGVVNLLVVNCSFKGRFWYGF